MHERARVSSSSRNQLSLYAAEAGVSTRAAARSSQNAENNDKIPKQSMSPHVAETVLDQHGFGRPNRAHKALSRKGGISWKKERKSAELKCRRRRHLVVTPPASINVTKHRARSPDQTRARFTIIDSCLVIECAQPSLWSSPAAATAPGLLAATKRRPMRDTSSMAVLSLR